MRLWINVCSQLYLSKNSFGPQFEKSFLFNFLHAVLFTWLPLLSLHRELCFFSILHSSSQIYRKPEHRLGLRHFTSLLVEGLHLKVKETFFVCQVSDDDLIFLSKCCIYAFSMWVSSVFYFLEQVQGSSSNQMSWNLLSEVNLVLEVLCVGYL